MNYKLLYWNYYIKHNLSLIPLYLLNLHNQDINMHNR